MDVVAFLTAAGGLAFFLYGMQLMSEGLSGVAGERLRNALERMMNRPYRAILMGAGITALIQSSSVTTVMVVGLVNSGVLNLSQAAGLIAGANIGTTITAWIFGAAGLSGAVLLCIASVLAVAGVGVLFLTKRQKAQNATQSLVGAAVLIYGMETMSGAMKSFAEAPVVTEILTKCSNPFSGVLAGMTITALIQSSSASVGVLQALCEAKEVSYRTVIPIVMGQNIGTCVTALLSCLGAGRNARRAAFFHLYFNATAAGAFLILFWCADRRMYLPWLERAADGVGIACVHSLFNIGAVLLLLPFFRELIKLSDMTVGRAGFRFFYLFQQK